MSCAFFRDFDFAIVLCSNIKIMDLGGQVLITPTAPAVVNLLQIIHNTDRTLVSATAIPLIDVRTVTPAPAMPSRHPHEPGAHYRLGRFTPLGFFCKHSRGDTVGACRGTMFRHDVTSWGRLCKSIQLEFLGFPQRFFPNRKITLPSQLEFLCSALIGPYRTIITFGAPTQRIFDQTRRFIVIINTFQFVEHLIFLFPHIFQSPLPIYLP